MQPIRDKVLVELDPVKESKIILIKEERLMGTVLATGPGTKNDPMTLKAGDRVRFHDNSGVPIKFEGKDCLLLREIECIAIL